MDLKGKTALITGGARMGEAVAEALSNEGCHVALIYRRSKIQAEEIARKARRKGVKTLLMAADLRCPQDLERIVPQVASGLGRLDILVNMASVYSDLPLKGFEEHRSGGTPAGLLAWEESLNVEARSAYWLSIKAAPLMRRHGVGRIINFSDWLPASGRPRYKDHFTYYVAKGAVKSLTEILALELAPEILVNAVAPGPILPSEGMPERARKAVEKETPLRRWGGAAEIARAVLFLAQTEFITGECLRVDGGRHLY
jgi:NAD(P)-dependent dehydrogenase (short-subunit alcohol dehydrogenase family)